MTETVIVRAVGPRGPASEEVEAVAAISAQIVTLAALDTELAALGPIADDIVTVSGISANVTSVAGISANVTTVAGISADVAIVAPIAADVTAVAADATDIGTVATNIANVNALGPIASDISGVNAISADVTTCADNIADIQAAAAFTDGFVGTADTDAGVVASYVDDDDGFISGVRSDGLAVSSAYTLRPSVYARVDAAGYSQIYARDRQGEHQLTYGPYDSFAPEVVNGGLIFFSSNRGGIGQRLYSMSMAGSTPALVGGKPLLVQCVIGQSLAVGNTAGAVTSPANADTRLVQLDITGVTNGPRTHTDGSRAQTNEANPGKPGEIVGIETLVDVLCPNASGSAFGQTIATALAKNLVKDNADTDVRIGVTVNARGAQRMQALRPPAGLWSTHMRAQEAFRKYGTTGSYADYQVIIDAFHIIQDHADIAAVQSRADRKAECISFGGLLRRMAIVDTGAGCKAPVLISQSSNIIYNGTSASNKTAAIDVWLGTLDACDETDWLHMVTAMYLMASHDGTHLTNVGSDLLGAYYGKVRHYLWEGRNWTPTRLRATGWERNGTSLFVPVDSFTGSLQRKTDKVAARTHDGFTITDGASLALSSAPTIDNEAGGLVFTLNSSSISGTATLRAACTGTTSQDPSNANAAGCNICDTDDWEDAYIGTVLENYMVHCEVTGIV